MKFHHITIEGITSLSQPIELNFEEILRGNDLFAITGATGSGKSSILTAISLALFGKGYKKLPVESYVSLGRNEAKVELRFSVQFKIYTALWKCKVSTSSKSGKSRIDVKKALLDGQGKVLDILPSELIGLSQDQFFKTIIINQGQFANFLMSSFKERKKLIEQLYDNTELSLIGPTLRRRMTDLQHEIDILEAKITGASLYSEEDIQEFQQQLDKKIIELEQLQRSESTILNLNDLIKNIYTTRLKLDQHQENLKINNKNLNVAINQYNESQKSYQQVVNLLESKKAHWTESKEKIRLAINKVNLLNEKKEQLLGFAKQAEIKKALLEQKEKKSDIAKTSIEKYQNDINTIHENSFLKSISHEQISDYIKRLTELESINKKHENLEKYKISLKDEVMSLNQKKAQLQKELTSYEQDWPKKIDSLKKKKEETRKGNQNILKVISRNEQDQKRLAELKKETADQAKLILEKSSAILKTKENILALKEVINKEVLAQKQIELQHAIELCQHENNNNDKCVVCHQDILQKTLKLDTIQPPQVNEKLKDFERRLATQETELKHKKQELANLKLLHEQTQQQSSHIKDELLLMAQQVLEKSCSIIDLGQSLQGLLEKNNNILKTIDQEINDAIKNAQIYSNKTSNLNELSTQNEKFNKKQEELEAEEQLYKDQMTSIIVQFPELSLEDVNSGSIPHLLESLNHYKSLLQQVEFAKKEIKALDTDIEQLGEILKKENTSFSQTKKLIDSTLEELKELYPHFQEKSPEIEQQQRESEIEQLNHKKDSLGHNLNDKEKNKNNLQQQSSLLNENIKSLELLLNQYSTQIDSALILKDEERPEELNFFLHKIRKFNHENILTIKKDIIEIIKNDLEEVLKQIKHQLSQCLVDKSKLTTLIEEDKSQREEKQTIQKQQNNLKKQYARLENLKDILQNEGFSKFALSLLEKNLLIYTNQELERLCDGRYQLMEKEVSKRDGPEFFVVDLWQNAQTRKVATLSGGETFLISLAMALSLAEMSRGQTNIDTFIIDEGFGTLDDNSIESVLDILMSIRSRGKQIGLISHIRKLTERIPVNIHMKKVQQTTSQVNVIYN